jgi:hypothetical protein
MTISVFAVSLLRCVVTAPRAPADTARSAVALHRTHRRKGDRTIGRHLDDLRLTHGKGKIICLWKQAQSGVFGGLLGCFCEAWKSGFHPRAQLVAPPNRSQSTRAARVPVRAGKTYPLPTNARSETTQLRTIAHSRNGTQERFRFAFLRQRARMRGNSVAEARETNLNSPGRRHGTNNEIVVVKVSTRGVFDTGEIVVRLR